jgi:hypothetical protein
MNDELTLYLLTIRGRLSPATLEEACKIHNMTAGDPGGVAAAKSLGDVSHMVYVPLPHDGHAPTSGAGEFLIMDLWTSPEGLNTFFSDHKVQEGGAMIFSERDPILWAPARGFTSYQIPAPFGMNDRIITMARATVKSLEEACELHNQAVARTVGQARKAGNLSHESYLRMAAPGSPEALEWLGVDVWMRPDEMMSLYEDPEFLEGFDHMFTGEADVSIWVHPHGDWIEW